MRVWERREGGAYIYKCSGMEDRETDPGYAGRHLRANSAPPKSAGWNSKPKQRRGTRDTIKGTVDDKEIYVYIVI